MPVRADSAVERLVAGRLAEAFPDDAFLGEEEGGEVGERAERLFLVGRA